MSRNATLGYSSPVVLLSPPSCSSVFPALLYRFLDPLCVFLAVVLVEVRSLDVGRRGGIGIIQETARILAEPKLSQPHNLIHNPIFLLYISLPLNTRQDRRNIIRRTPPVLQDIQAQLPSGVDIGMEHLADELDRGWLVWVLLLELHD